MFFRKGNQSHVVTMLLLFILLLSGCAGERESIETAELTVEPYELSEQEARLVSKTGVGFIEYFKLNGKIEKGDVLVFSVEEHKNGKTISDVMKSWEHYNGEYNDVIISFGTNDSKSVNEGLDIMLGVPSGLLQGEQTEKKRMNSMCRTIVDKTSLQKDKPVYLTMLKGTDGNILKCSISADGEVQLEDTDVAYLFKILWTEEEKVIE